MVMSRGMSDFQVVLLATAYRNMVNERLPVADKTGNASLPPLSFEELAKMPLLPPDPPLHLYTAEAMRLKLGFDRLDVYGWRRGIYQWRDSLKEVDRRTFRSAQASISRTFRRFQEHDLVVYKNRGVGRSGISLTEKGVQVLRSAA